MSTALDVEMAVLRKFVNELLTQLEEDIDREKLRNMLVYSKKLSAFEKKASLIRNALAEILDNGPTPLPPPPTSSLPALFLLLYVCWGSCGEEANLSRRGSSRDVLDGKITRETTGRGSA